MTNMPGVAKGKTKIFVGNLSSQATSDVIRKLFEEYGEVSECDVLRNYGFVHMDSPDEAEAAIEALNGYEVMGQNMVVEASTGMSGKRDSRGGGAVAGIRRGGTKIFIGNLPIQATPDYLIKQFQEFGTVMECDILKNYGFVHMDTPQNAQSAIKALHGKDVFGQKMTVEASTSDVRKSAGMGGANKCFRCGSGGHWSKDCPEAPPGGRRRAGHGPGPMRGMRSREPRGYYPHEYAMYDRYDPYARYDDHYPPPPHRRLPPPPPPPPRRPSPTMGGAMPYSSRAPDPRDYYYPPRREYSPDRRYGGLMERRHPPPPPPDPRDPYYPPPRRDERDPYGMGAAAGARDHYPPPRDHYPPAPADYRRDYASASAREYSSSRGYPPAPPPREYDAHSSRYGAAPQPRELPRAYGGTGGRTSLVAMRQS